jgi:hypothetical protein
MKAFQRNNVLIVAGIIVIVGASIVYLFTTGFTSTQSHNVVTPTSAATPTVTLFTHLPELSQPRAVKACSSKQRNFQMGIAFPDWGTTAYDATDTKWLTGLYEMQINTAACWVEMPVLFHQSSLTSTTVVQGPATSQLSSFIYGVQFAHSLGLHVFVTLQLQSAGSQAWSGAINFSTTAQTQQWFESYWQAIKPYAVASAQNKVEQFAIGTEYAWLEQNAPASLWNGLIDEVSKVFPGNLTYDMNWGSLQTPPPSWMRNTHLKMIGVSAYLPLIDTPKHVDPKEIYNLWKQTVKVQLDNFAVALGEPIFLSEIGYPNSQIALYHPWDSSSSAPTDPAEQAAACDAALANIIPDKNILGSFFWGWDNTGDFNLNAVQAATVINSYYKSLQS